MEIEIIWGDITLQAIRDFEDPDNTSLPWLQTPTGRQWFACFRICGPGKAAFDGSWKPSG